MTLCIYSVRRSVRDSHWSRDYRDGTGIRILYENPGFYTYPARFASSPSPLSSSSHLSSLLRSSGRPHLRHKWWPHLLLRSSGEKGSRRPGPAACGSRRSTAAGGWIWRLRVLALPSAAAWRQDARATAGAPLAGSKLAPQPMEGERLENLRDSLSPPLVSSCSWDCWVYVLRIPVDLVLSHTCWFLLLC
jgi:hypothetical protein